MPLMLMVAQSEVHSHEGKHAEAEAVHPHDGVVAASHGRIKVELPQEEVDLRREDGGEELELTHQEILKAIVGGRGGVECSSERS